MNTPGLGGLPGRGVLVAEGLRFWGSLGMHSLSQKRRTLVKCVILGMSMGSLTGCASWDRETRIEETTYQLLSATDALQSWQAARRPECYGEGDPMTRAVLGAHPAPAGALAWPVLRGLTHAWVTNWLEIDDSDIWLKRAWQAVTITYEARDVRQNSVIGLRIGSARPPSYAPCLKGK